MRIGANYESFECDFTVWAPNRKNVTLMLNEGKQRIEMGKEINGYWTTKIKKVTAGAEYFYLLDDEFLKPDPATYYQPKGVFGPSAIVDHKAFEWADYNWRGLELKDLIFYELHVGAFSPEGTFKAINSRLKELCDFGVNAIELMPITQFSGKRGWGYDSVFPFAVQDSYGHPDDLKALINEAHKQGLAVFLDFVYNHTGPEGNVLNDFGPYFKTDKLTAWGPTINLDGENCLGVRNFFLENALNWFGHYHIDGIRLDAVLWMYDNSQKHFLQELNQAVAEYAEKVNRKLHMIAESGFNDPKVLFPFEKGGFNFDAQWLDDYQHALFVQLTNEKEGYYKDYLKFDYLLEALTYGYVYVEKDPTFRRRRPDELFDWISAYRLIVFSQNHDQVGNRLLGDRLISLSGLEAAKVAAGIVLLSPYVPLLFMGEEYGETVPFLFFTDYSGKELSAAIREGRRKEFFNFNWQGEVPDPQSLETFSKSKINWQQRYQGIGSKILAYYKTLIKLRRNLPALQASKQRNIKQLSNQGKVLFFKKQKGNSEAVVIANFGKDACPIELPFDSRYVKVIDSLAVDFGGSGMILPNELMSKITVPGLNFAVYSNLEVSC